MFGSAGPLLGQVSYNPGPKGNAPLQLLGELCYKAFEHQVPHTVTEV